MGRLKVVPSRVNNTLFCYCGDGAIKVRERSAEDSGIRLVAVWQAEFERMIRRGTYAEAAGIAIYYLAKLKGYL